MSDTGSCFEDLWSRKLFRTRCLRQSGSWRPSRHQRKAVRTIHLSIHTDLMQCFQIVQSVLRLQPRRQFPVLCLPHSRFCAASDAALESPGQGTGGFLIVWFQNQIEKREAFLADIPPAVYHFWTPGDKKIAQLELSQVLYALIAGPSQGRRVVWFIDNIAALMALIRGRSDSPDLERWPTLSTWRVSPLGHGFIGSTSPLNPTGLMPLADWAWLIHGAPLISLHCFESLFHSSSGSSLSQR